MISISHSQAQQLIRRALDQPVADQALWSALQAHLESCAACRAYREQRLGVERDLRRGLRARWQGTVGPQPGLGGRLAVESQARSRRRQRAFQAGLVLAVCLLAFLWLRDRAAGPAPQAPLPPPPTAAPTPTPTPEPGEGFQGVLAFEARPGGNADIFLLETGPAGTQLTNLTDHPARDFEPAWSPDGAWIAFLSNRDRTEGSGAASGADIYIISVAGTRLTRLTADPSLSWSGPLAWSPDGRWIAATGTRRISSGGSLESERWIYRVNLDGSPPSALPYSRGASTPRFAPNLPLLAYLAEDDQLSFLRLYDARSGRTHDLLRGENVLGSQTGPGSAVLSDFDWSPDGATILYTVLQGAPERDPNYVLLRRLDIMRQIEGLGQAVDAARRSGRLLGNFPAITPVISASLSAGGELMYTRSYWRGGRGPACRPLESVPRALTTGLPVVCVESSIERAAWSSDGRWLAFAGQAQDEDRPGIYVFGLPGGERDPRAAERLHDLPAEINGAVLVRPDRPGAVLRPIDPQPARSIVLELPAVPPKAMMARVLLTRRGPAGISLRRLEPDGTGSAPLLTGAGAVCPSVSPDGSAVVYLGDSGQGRSDLYVIEEGRPDPRRVTRREGPARSGGETVNPPLAGRYGCAAWSPDGSTLAAWVEAGGRTFLALIPAEGVQPGSPARYLPVESPETHQRPIWSPDGRRLLFIQDRPGMLPAELAALDARSGRVTRLAAAPGWSGDSQAALSPDGSRLAYITQLYSPTGQIQAHLRLIHIRTGQSEPPLRLPIYDPLETAADTNGRVYSSQEFGSLAWVGNNRLGLAYFGSRDGNVPAALLLYDLETRAPATLETLNEDLLSADWSPDGRWVLYSTPSGLWSLSVRGALSRSSAPVWLAGEVAYEINWH